MKRLKLKITNGSLVKVIAGDDRGRQGAVLEIDPVKLKVKVQGINIQTHFSKKDGIQKKEGFFDYSNVQLIEKAADKKKATSKKKSKVNSQSEE